MLNVGASELFVILLVALLVLGPDKLPAAARQVGRAMGELRRLSSGFQAEVRDAFQEPVPSQPTPRSTTPVGPASDPEGATTGPAAPPTPADEDRLPEDLPPGTTPTTEVASGDRLPEDAPTEDRHDDVPPEERPTDAAGAEDGVAGPGDGTPGGARPA